MTTQTLGVDFLHGVLPAPKDIIFTTAEWIENVKDVVGFPEADGFVILRRYDDIPSYGLHMINKGEVGYASRWSALVSPQGACAFQNLLLAADFFPIVWQDINVDEQHELFIGSILPVEWKGSAFWAHLHLIDRLWLYVKG